MKTETKIDKISLVGEVVSTFKKKGKISELPMISSSKDACAILLDLINKDSLDHYECFWCLFLSRSNKVLGFSVISRGGVNGTVADPKIIMQNALLANASGIILAHNHPSQNTRPSQQDINLTKKMKSAGELLDISVLDHIIITSENGYYSFADECMM